MATLLVMGLVGCGGDGGAAATRPVSQPPLELPPPASLPVLALNDTLTRELRAYPHQTDTLRFVATGARRVHIDLQHLAEPQSPAGGLQCVVVDSASGTFIWSIHGSIPPTRPFGTDLSDHGLNWIRVPANSTYLIIVSANEQVTAPPYVGPYRVRIVGSDPGPESARVALAVGESVAEAIDRPGDVDEFLITANAGTSDLVLALHSETGVATDTMLVEPVVGSDRFWQLPLSQSAGDEPEPMPSERFGMALGQDTLRVRVRAVRGTITGAYRLSLSRVDRAPERAARQVMAGDTVTEALDYARDIDEFTFIGDVGRQYAVAFQGTSGSTRDTVELLMEGAAQRRSTGTSDTMLSQISGRFPGGSYSVRVTGTNDIVKRGGYRFAILPIDPRPESVPATLTIGDTIADRIDIAPDVDEYTLALEANERVVIYAQAMDSDTSTQLLVRSFDSDIALDMEVPGAASTLRATRSDLLGMPRSGTLRLRVTGLNGFHGAYRLAVARIDMSPETIDPRLSLDVIVSGILDPAGDVDEFTFEGVKGQQITAYVASPLGVSLTFEYPGRSLAFFASWSTRLFAGEGTGLLTLWESGTFHVRVVGATSTPIPYQVVIYGLKRAPERVPATLHIGDTVDGESIEPSQDIDEFQLVAPPGSKFSVCILNQAPKYFAWNDRIGATSPLPPIPGYDGDGYASSGSGATVPSCGPPMAMPSSGATSITVFGPKTNIVPYRLEIRSVP